MKAPIKNHAAIIRSIVREELAKVLPTIIAETFVKMNTAISEINTGVGGRPNMTKGVGVVNTHRKASSVSGNSPTVSVSDILKETTAFSGNQPLSFGTSADASMGVMSSADMITDIEITSPLALTSGAAIPQKDYRSILSKMNEHAERLRT